jgi:DNA-binding response OmpR family regulator
MRVLVVEDERDLADGLAEALRGEGYAVDVAYDGETARVNMAVYPYDVVTLDLNLPDADGRELCRAVRAAERRDGAAPPRIVMLTARDTLDDRVGGLDDGADEYLVKPVALPELLARVRALLRRSAGETGATLRIGDLELDTARHETRYRGEQVDLSPKEFALLRYLMSNPGTVLSEGHLLTHVWDENANPYTKTVRVTIMTLRRKLREHGAEPIETVSGVGYRLREP